MWEGKIVDCRLNTFGEWLITLKAMDLAEHKVTTLYYYTRERRAAELALRALRSEANEYAVIDYTNFNRKVCDGNIYLLVTRIRLKPIGEVEPEYLVKGFAASKVGGGLYRISL